jgi:hypothetical protein
MEPQGLEATLKTNYIGKKKKKKTKKRAMSLVLPEHKLEGAEKGVEGIVEKKRIYTASEPEVPMSVYKRMSSEEKGKTAAKYFKKKSEKYPESKEEKKYAEEAMKSYIKIKKKKKKGY